MKETIYKIRSRKKSLTIALIILLIITIPSYIIGWYPDLLVPMFGNAAVHGLIWVFVPSYILVPPLSFASSLILVTLALTDHRVGHKVFCVALGIVMFVISTQTFIDFIS